MSCKIIIIGDPSQKLLQFALANQFEIEICPPEKVDSLESNLLYSERRSISRSLDILAEECKLNEIKIANTRYPTKQDRRNWRKFNKN